MQWLLDLLASQGAVIKDAFPSFVLVCVLAIVVLYFVFERLYKARLESRDGLITSLKERLAFYENARRDQPASQPRPDLEIKFSDGYIQDRGNFQRYRIGVYNSGPATANEVEVLITKIVPAPKSKMFRADFPYQLKGVDGNPGKRNINSDREEKFELCESWVADAATGGGVIIGKMDTKPGGEHFNFRMQSDEVWRVHVEVLSANANRAAAILLFQPGDKAVLISRIDDPVAKRTD